MSHTHTHTLMLLEAKCRVYLSPLLYTHSLSKKGAELSHTSHTHLSHHTLSHAFGNKNVEFTPPLALHTHTPVTLHHML